MVDVGNTGVKMPRIATSGASRETKPNRPKVKPASDNFATSGHDYACWIPSPCMRSDVNATSVGSNDDDLHTSAGDRFSDTTEG